MFSASPREAALPRRPCGWIASTLHGAQPGQRGRNHRRRRNGVDPQPDRRHAFGPSARPRSRTPPSAGTSGTAPLKSKALSPAPPTCEAPWLSPCAASTFHSYQYGGTYSVTLTVTDVDGNKTSVTHEVTVVGPPPPAPAGTAGSGSAPAARRRLRHEHAGASRHAQQDLRRRSPPPNRSPAPSPARLSSPTRCRPP